MAKQKKVQKKVVVKGNQKKEQLALREKVVALIQKGWTTERIVGKYPQLNKLQVAGYKSHVAMGTYK